MVLALFLGVPMLGILIGLPGRHHDLDRAGGTFGLGGGGCGGAGLDPLTDDAQGGLSRGARHRPACFGGIIAPIIPPSLPLIPTEAAVVAAVYAILISTLVYREMTLKGFVEVLMGAGRATAMVMFLVGAAMVAAWLITVAQLPQQLAQMLEPLIDRPRLLMLVIMLLALAVGMVMDLSPTVLILVPLLMPVVKMAGIDEVYFGLTFVMNCSIGLLTPPVGTVLNVVCGVSRVPMSQAVRGVFPFIMGYIVLLGLFVAFPQLITVPARILGG